MNREREGRRRAKKERSGGMKRRMGIRRARANDEREVEKKENKRRM